MVECASNLAISTVDEKVVKRSAEGKDAFSVRVVNSGCGNCLADLVDVIPVVRRHLKFMTVE